MIASARQRLARVGAWASQNPDACAVLAVTALYLAGRAASRYPAIDGDGHYTWLWARSLAFDLDLDLDNDVRLCGDPWRRGVGPSGHNLNQWPAGSALIWVPLLWLARLLMPSVTSTDLATACRGPWADIGVSGSALAAAASLGIAALVARRHQASRGAIALAVALVGLCSMLPYYAVVLPSYSHASTALSTALFIERWDSYRDRPTPRRALLLGALLGFATLTRTQSAALALLPLCDAAADLAGARARGDLARTARRWALPALLFIAAALVVESPYRWALHRMYGSAFAIPQGSAYMRWSHSHPLGLLFSSYNGLLTTTPLLYPATAALLALPLWRRHRSLWPLTALFALALYINGSVWDWWGEASFSTRRLTDFALPFVLATALVIEAFFRLADRAPRAAAASSVAAFLSLAALWNRGAMMAEAEGRTRQIGARPSPERWTPVADHAGRALWRDVGNPLSWPASLPFALWRGVHPRAFDRLVGEGYLRRSYENLAADARSMRFEFTSPDEHFTGQFSAPEGPTGGRGRTLGGAGRVLLPLFDDTVAAVEIEATPHEETTLSLRWNGAALAPLKLGAEAPKGRIELPAGVAGVGVNELRFESSAPLLLRSMTLVERPRP